MFQSKLKFHLLVKRYWLIGIFLIGFLYPAYANEDKHYFHQIPGYGITGEDLELSVMVNLDEPITQANLFFRQSGELSYEEIHMVYQAGNWSGIIPGERLSTEGLEYAIILKTVDGGLIAIPNKTSLDAPQFIPILPGKTSEKGLVRSDDLSMGKTISTDILILSPEPGEYVLPDEVIIVLSLFNAPNIDTSSIQVQVNGIDYTSSAEIGGGIINLIPDKLNAGLQKVSVRLKTIHGLEVKPVEWSFTIAKLGFDIKSQLVYSGDISSQLYTENVAGNTRKVTELTGNLKGGLTWITSKNNFRLTNRESEFQQPYNRISGNIKIGEYLKIDLGDFYPRISGYLIDGKRIRGIGVDFHFPWIRIQAVHGELNRSVQWSGTVDGGYTLLSNETILDSAGRSTFKLDRRGYTFKRMLDAYRLTFNLSSKYMFSLHALKAKDEVNSVKKFISEDARFTVDLDSAMTEATGISSGIYNYSRFLTAIGANDTIIFPSKRWGGDNPVDNLVLGFDIGTAFDNRNLIFEFGWNMSLYNRNIWDGTMTRAEMDVALDTIPDGLVAGDVDTSDIFDPKKYEGLFIVNTYMTPLVPFDYVSFKNHPISTVVNMPSSAFHFKLKGNYYRNNFLIEYRQVGPEFVSLGNPYLLSNIREFSFSDRLALLDRKLLLSTSFNHRNNKILRTTVDPVSTNTFSATATLIPGADIPSLIINFQSVTKSNEKDTLDIIGSRIIDLREKSRTINSLMSLNYPFRTGAIRHNLIVNYSDIKNSDLLSDDRESQFLFQKTDTKTFSVNFSSQYGIPLKTLLNFNKTELFLPVKQNGVITKIPYTWTGFGANVQYSMFNNRLDIWTGFSYLNSNGNIKSNLFGVKFGSEYKILDDLFITLSGDLQMHETPAYKKDNIDNDGNGQTDEFMEAWKINTSGILLTVGYKF